MAITLTGRDLTREQVVRVARGRERVELSPAALARMQASRDVVGRSLARGESVYGLTTGVGVLKRVGVERSAAARYGRRLIGDHRIAQGPPASKDHVRAMMVCLANAYAGGSTGVRPVLAQRLAAELNDDRVPTIRSLGSVGQADLAQMADLAAWLVDDLELAPGEGLALLSGNSFSTAGAVLAVADALVLVETTESTGALSLEALAANPGLLHPAIAITRPYPGLRTSLARLRALLEGSYLWSGDRARSLQDPLTFRNLPHLQGACRDVLAHVDAVLGVELNASQGNPIVVADEDRLVSVANYEIAPLAAALDYARIGLVPALSASAERAVKLLERAWSGLPTGLAARGDDGVTPAHGVMPAEDAPSSPLDAPDAGLSFLGIAVQSLAAEARLLAAPVSFEIASTAHAEGIEDRTTMAALAARRLSELVGLGRRIAAVELTVACQAVELRGHHPLGQGTSAALALVRASLPFRRAGKPMPDVERLLEPIERGLFGADALSSRVGPG